MSSYTNEIRRDLRSLSIYLGNWDKNVKNSEVLANIHCHEEAGMIYYSLNKSKPLTFQNIDIERHVIPKGIDKLCPKTERFFEVDLIMRLIQSNAPGELEDPIHELGVAIKVEGEYESGNDYKKAVCSWHLDKDNGGASLYSHPTYHLNFGGDLMADKLEEEDDPNFFGGLLLLASPRVLHPPMDIILSCDFIIKNFYEKSKHQSLTTTPGYKELIERAKARYLKPYVYALGSIWDSSLTVSNLTHDTAYG